MLDQDDRDSILSSLMGKVFHATTIEALEQIEKSSYISPNFKDRFTSPFGRYNGYFKSRGCVSFFDYRPQEELDNYINQCLPTQIFERSMGIAILELSDKRYTDLISWHNWKKEGSFLQVVPYVETGLEGIVSLSDICNVRVIERPTEYQTTAELYRSLGIRND